MERGKKLEMTFCLDVSCIYFNSTNTNYDDDYYDDDADCNDDDV